MAQNNLANFENTFFEDENCFKLDNPDVLAAITIDGFPEDQDAEGTAVATVYITMHGDIVVAWHHNGYRLNETVCELIQDSKKRLFDYHNEHFKSYSCKEV